MNVWIPLKGEEAAYDLKEHKDEVLALAWSPTGPGTLNINISLRLATASSDGTVKLWDMENGKCIVTFNQHTGPVNAVAFSPNYEYLSSGGSDGTVRLYSMKELRHLRSLVPPGLLNVPIDRIFGLGWDYGSKILAAATSVGLLVIDTRYV